MTTTLSRSDEHDEQSAMPVRETRAQLLARIARQKETIKNLLRDRASVDALRRRAVIAEGRAVRLVEELRRLSRESNAPALAAALRNFRLAVRNRFGDFVGGVSQRGVIAAADRAAAEILEKHDAMYSFHDK